MGGSLNQQKELPDSVALKVISERWEEIDLEKVHTTNVSHMDNCVNKGFEVR